MNVSLLLRTTQSAVSTCRNLNCWTAAITKKHRNTHVLTYPTVLVQPDGSSINIEYHEPVQIITLPLNVDTISEAERLARIAARKPLSKIEIQDEIDDDFDETEYYSASGR